MSLAAETQAAAEALIVQVDARFTGGETEKGSGILVGHQHGYLYVLTADHVVRQELSSASEVMIRFRFWRQEAVAAELLEARDFDQDLAMLRVRLDAVSVPSELVEEVASVTDGGGRSLERGDRLYPVGNPQGRPWFVPVDPPPVVKTELHELHVEYDCEGGYSGGGFFDGEWRLRGMIQRFDGKLCLGLDFTVIRQVIEELWDVPMNLVLAADPAPAPGAEEAGPRIVVVLVDGSDPELVELAKELIEAQLSRRADVVLVERERLAPLLTEQKLGLVFGGDSADASALAGQLGADLILLGSLGEARVERRAFSGYNINGVADHYSMDLGLRLVDVASGRVVYADSFEARDRELYRQAESAPDQAVDRGPGLVRKLVEDAGADLAAGFQSQQ